MNYRGHIEKGMVVLDQPLPLPDGTPVRVEAIAPPAADFWRSSSLDELAAEQGVSAPASVEELLGGWPADELNDGVEEALARWRARSEGNLRDPILESRRARGHRRGVGSNLERPAPSP